MKYNQNRWLKFGLFILFMPFLGCVLKEDFALPVDFKMNFGIKNETVLNGSITINNIGLSLSSIDISGRREQGGDVFLTRTFDNGNIFRIYPSINTYTEKLNIPHGIYNTINFLFNFKPDENESYLIDELHAWIVEYEAYFEEDFEEGFENGFDLINLQEELGEIIAIYLEQINPCIIVRGTFSHNSVTKNIVLVINDPVKFNILGLSGAGQREVFLDRNIINNGLLQFDPAYWFAVLTPERMNTAFTGLIGNEEYILLSKHINHQIYFSLLDRIEESTILLIND